MAEKISLYLFIHCVIICQGIIGAFSEDVGELNSLVRSKRVINLEPGGDIPLQRGDAPFVANVRKLPYNNTICVGSILSRYTVITAAAVVALLDVSFIKIHTSAAYSNRGIHHNVIAKHMHFGNHPQRENDGVALLTVEKAFFFNSYTKPIALHTGPLLAGTPATIYGWGYNNSTQRGTNYRLQLRFITLPIMRHRECVDFYRNRAEISDKDICTYDENKRCGHTDVGAPLVVDNHLAGLYLWTGITPGHINPDVFAVIQHAEYAQWIRNHMLDI